MEEKAHKRAIWAWTMYDWGNSGFVTTIMAAVLPVYYSSVAASNLPANVATAILGLYHQPCCTIGCCYFSSFRRHGRFPW